MARRKRLSPADSRAFWTQIISEWRQSGMKPRAFCQERELTESQFYLWRRRLGETASEPKPRLLPVSIEPTSNLAITAEVNGVNLSIPKGIDEHTLQAVIRVVKGL